MAAFTKQGRAFENAIQVALPTFYTGMGAIQRESGFGVVIAGLLPAVCRMAGGAILPKLALVMVVIRMTGGAVLWCAPVNLIDMTGITIDIGMFSGELKACLAVVEGGLFPGIRGMAGLASCSKPTLVRIVLGVAVKTDLAYVLKILAGARILMTRTARYAGMFTGQLER